MIGIRNRIGLNTLRRGGGGSPVQLTVDFTDTQFNFKFKLPSTSSVDIYDGDGDGTKTTIVGQDTTIITHTTAYSEAGSYTFYVEGDYLDLTWIDIGGNSFVSGDVSGWSKLINLTQIEVDYTGVSGDVSGWSVLINLTFVKCKVSSVSGDVSSWSSLTNLTRIICDTTAISGDVSGWSSLINLTHILCYDTSISGDISGWSALTSLVNLSIANTFVSGDVSSLNTLLSLLAGISLSGTYVTFDSSPVWSASGVTLVLSSINNGGATSAMIDNMVESFATCINCTIDISGTNEARTSDSDAAMVTLLANGNTVTVNE